MNNRKLFVGNLTFSVREGQLKALFSRFGEVISVRILEKKGYGFVEMSTEEQAKSAREALSETEFEGRNLLIDDVRPFLKPKKGAHKPVHTDRLRSGQGSRPAKPSSSYGYRGKKPNPSGHGSGRPGQGSSSSRRSSMPPRRNSGSGSRRF